MGSRKQPRNASLADKIGYYNIIPFLAYYDIFKNYYANKQEERFYVMGGSSIQNATTIVSGDFEGIVYRNTYTFDFYCKVPTTVTITGTYLKLEDIKQIKFTLDSEPIYIKIVLIEDWEKVSVEKNKIVLKTKEGLS